MSLFRRRPSTHYGDCAMCGHDWREHPGGGFKSDPVECGECQDEANHGSRAEDAGPLCRLPAPTPSPQRLDERQVPPPLAPYGAYALHVLQQDGAPIVELHLTATQPAGFEVFLPNESFVVEYGRSVRLRCYLGSGSLQAEWTPVGLVLNGSDGLAQANLLAEGGTPLPW